MQKLIDRVRALLSGLFYRNFFSLLLIAVAAAQWACVGRLLFFARQGVLPAWVHVAAVGVLYGFNLAIIRYARRVRLRRAPGFALRVYTGASFVALFCAVFMLASGAVWVVLRGILGALSAQALSSAGQATFHSGIEAAFQGFVSLGMGGIGLTMLYGYVFGQHELRVTQLPLPLRGFPGRLAGIRIAQISDVHVGQNLTIEQLRQFVDRVNALAPDLICITGDIADSPQADYAKFFPVLGTLRARYGVCAILGNHDHYAGADRVATELRRWTDFVVLRDEAITLDVDGAPLHVIGLDDRGRDWARGLIFDARLADLMAEAPAGVPTLLLAHRPDIFHQAAGGGVALTLSGHTHGGQLAVPWLGGRRRNLAEFITPFDRGLYERDGCYLYVNSGLGVTGQRIRLFTPREISVIEAASPV